MTPPDPLARLSDALLEAGDALDEYKANADMVTWSAARYSHYKWMREAVRSLLLTVESWQAEAQREAAGE